VSDPHPGAPASQVIIERSPEATWALPNTPAAVSVTGILGVTVLEGIALSHGMDGNHFYAALGIIAAICGIHMRFAPLIAGSRR
jgi:hypothetical protein